VVARQIELGHGLAELRDRVALVLRRELAVDGPPHVLLRLRVVDLRRRLARGPGQGCAGDLAAALAVRGIVGAGVVVGKVDCDLAVVAFGDG